MGCADSPSQLVVIPAQPYQVTEEQTINNVIMLRQFVVSVKPIYEALDGATSALLAEIREVVITSQSIPSIADKT